MRLVGELEHRDHAGNPDRAAADDRVPEMQRLAARIEEQGLGRRRRRGLAAVIGTDLAPRGVVVEQEGAAADARRLRLDDVEHHLYGDRSVGGAAARAQDAEAGPRRMRVGRGHHVARRPGRFRGVGRQEGHERQKQRCQDSTHAHRGALPVTLGTSLLQVRRFVANAAAEPRAGVDRCRGVG